MSSDSSNPRAIYEIQVRGELGQDWKQWFNGMDITLTHASGQLPTTTLSGPVADQAALRGMLCKLWDLNLTLISVRRTAAYGKERPRDE